MGDRARRPGGRQMRDDLEVRARPGCLRAPAPPTETSSAQDAATTTLVGDTPVLQERSSAKPIPQDDRITAVAVSGDAGRRRVAAPLRRESPAASGATAILTCRASGTSRASRRSSVPAQFADKPVSDRCGSRGVRARDARAQQRVIAAATRPAADVAQARQQCVGMTAGRKSSGRSASSSSSIHPTARFRR